jgi:Mrp family chromosome partitioning ATPase
MAAALAHRVAELDPASNFCLADFDFTNSGLSFLLGLEAEVGISNVLLDQASVEEALAATRLPNLSVLPAGHPSVGRQVTQMYDRCQELCELLTARFNYVFLDVPSLRKHPNFTFWAGGRARAILVVRAGQSRLPTVTKALQLLQFMRLEVAGIALNAREFYVPAWLYART